MKDLEPALDRVIFVVARLDSPGSFNSQKTRKGFEL